MSVLVPAHNQFPVPWLAQHPSSASGNLAELLRLADAVTQVENARVSTGNVTLIEVQTNCA
jgi:hypothetical protein